MCIFLIYLFVYSLDLVKSLNVRSTTRQDGPVSSYIGAAKTAKLLNYIQKMREWEKNYPMRTGQDDNKNPTMIETMKLLQKNYDTARNYDMDNPKRRVNFQYISNPEELELYRRLPSRRDDDKYYDISLDRQRSYGEEAKRNSRISMHFLKKLEGNTGFSKSNKAVASSSDSDSDSTSSDDDDDDGDNENDDESRRSVINFRVDEELDNTVEKSDDVPDVTLPPEEAFDIVKPFIVEIFNKLKEKNGEAKEKEDFYDPKKTASSDEKEQKLLKLDITEITTKTPVEFWTRPTDPHDTVKENQEREIKLKKIQEDELLRLLTTPDQLEVTESWRKKEKEKKSHKEENMYRDKRNRNSRENKGRYTEDDDWNGKKLPASKKSFVEPTFAHKDGWDDQGYGYWKKTNWDKRGAKTSREKLKTKDDFDEMHILNKMNSKENKKEDSYHRNRDDKGKGRDRKKNEWSQYLKSYDDWDKKHSKKNEWDKPLNKKDGWDKPLSKNDNWDKPFNKKDHWDILNSDKDDWDKAKNKKKDWNTSNNEKDDWDTPKIKKDDWDNPKHKKDNDWDNKDDNWDRKKDDWGEKDDNWNKKKDDWDKKDIKKDKKLPDNKNRDKGWDIVGLDTYKRSAEKPYAKQSFGDKKKSLYSEWGNYESFRNTKDDDNKVKEQTKDDFEDDFKPKKKDDFDDDYKRKKKTEWDGFVPKISNDWDNKPRKAKRYDSYEKKPASVFGRTSIPIVGKKAVYAD